MQLTIGGRTVPPFLYGTAWKEAATRGHVQAALEAGFRGIDTANQRKHYHEAGVGEALRAALEAGRLRRDDIFIQTKFTHLDGQDHRLPYDRAAPVRTQVHQSCASSLDHLPVGVIDSYVMHGPTVREGLAEADLEAWRGMEELHAAGKVRLLGVSNVTRAQLALLCDEAKVPPVFVQNRCYARTGWDRAVRELCRARGIVYQGFSLLTANVREMARPAVRDAARRTGWTPEQVVFRFALQVGMLPLTGTTDPTHMRQDLAVVDGPALTEREVAAIEAVGQ